MFLSNYLLIINKLPINNNNIIIIYIYKYNYIYTIIKNKKIKK